MKNEEKIVPADVNLSDKLWYKDAIIYQLHIKSFFDSNNDGMGDFTGLTAKLDYLQELGVNTLWLLPFYPSPMRDDGYDIADYDGVNPAYGTIEDFRRFVEEAHARGLRVVTELVINHTSDQHPWFQRARKAPAGSPERDFYVWSDTHDKYQGTRIIFSDTETSNWTWDKEANAYFWHRFFSHQPDLNFDNPEVLKEVLNAMYFWLDMGVDGLRLDAVPYLCEREGTNNENLPETHAIIKKIRAALDARFEGRMLLAEANQWPEDVVDYFGNEDECHMAFHFPLMPRIYMAVAQEDRYPISDILRQTPEIPPSCQWAAFLRNHDELTLEMVTDRERDYLWNFYATDKRARINFGIRRRLATLMDNDRRKIELLNGLLMSMPGTPIIYYGDEIGMGDNIFLGDRNGVRTPMQWSPDRNGGFSRADPAQLYLPAIMDAVYGYQSVNVEAQQRGQNSLLNWMRNLIHTVKECKAFGRGELRLLSPSNRKVLAYMRSFESEKILCVANLSRTSQPVELLLKDHNGLVPVEMLGNTRFPAIGELPYFLTMPPYAFYWFRLVEKNVEVAEAAENAEWLTLVAPKGWDSIFTGRVREALERQILPSFLARQRWCRIKNAGQTVVQIEQVYPLGDYRLVLVRADNDYYTMVLGISWESAHDEGQAGQRQALCRVRQVNRVGTLYEAFSDDSLMRSLMAALMAENTVDAATGRLVFYHQPQLSPRPAEELAITFLGAEQSNSSILVDHDLMFKAIRQPQAGINPEEEIGRFLTETSPFERTPQLVGGMRIEGANNEAITIGLLQQAVKNQGDGWKVTLDYLERLISDLRAMTAEERNQPAIDRFGYYLTLAEQLGRRTGELHNALEKTSGDAAFDPEPFSGGSRAEALETANKMTLAAMDDLQHVLSALPVEIQAAATSLLAERAQLQETLEGLLPADIQTPRIRVHGDYHLGQVLVAENDFYIIDFEGEPTRPLAERRKKTSPFKDVAGMIRSFDYAAATALKNAKVTTREEANQLRTALSQWRDAAATAFLDGYRAQARQYDPLPVQEKLTRFFLVEKALYEIVYETQHRPDWVEIPVRGLLSMIEQEEKP